MWERIERGTHSSVDVLQDEVMCIRVLVFFVFVLVVRAGVPDNLPTCATLSVEPSVTVETVLVVARFVVDGRTVVWAAMHAWPRLTTDVAELGAALTTMTG